MSILAYVAKINAFLSKYIHEQKSTDFFFFFKPPNPPIAPLYQGQGQHNKLRKEQRDF